MQDRRAGGPRGRARAARARADRPRRDERLGRARARPARSTASSRCSGSRPTSSTTAASREAKVERNHLTLLAADDEGFRNLVKLSSAGFLEGLHRGKPGVDLELLVAPRRRRDLPHGLPGLAVEPADRRRPPRPTPARTSTTSCRSSAPRTSTSRSSATASPSRSRSTRRSRASRREMGRPLVATADVHYLRREDYDHHAALLCVQTKSTLAQPKMSFDTNEFYLKSSEEMAESFADMPEALATTLEIAERCDVTIELGRQLIPRFETPGRPGRARVPALAGAGGAARGATASPPPAEAVERMEMELGVIDKMGFCGYFLIVWDFVALREVQRDRGRPGPWLGRRLARRLLPGDHGRRPAPLRPAVRALPERRARVDAGHRHRLLGPRPRARDPLRDREVRRRPRGPDHHVRQDVPARGHARRGARARPRVRRSATGWRS